MRRVRRRDTPPEVALRRAFRRRGLGYRVDFRALPDAPWRVDVAFVGRRVAVYVDGCFWHRCPQHGSMPRANAEWWASKLRRTSERDAQATRELTEAGWQVVRVWEHEDVEDAADRITALVRAHRQPR